MANPLSIACPAGVWTKVATNVTAGQLKKQFNGPMYLETYRMTGNAAPTEQTDGVPCFIGAQGEVISAAHAIDIYIMAVGSDGQARVDLP